MISVLWFYWKTSFLGDAWCILRSSVMVSHFQIVQTTKYTYIQNTWTVYYCFSLILSVNRKTEVKGELFISEVSRITYNSARGWLIHLEGISLRGREKQLHSTASASGLSILHHKPIVIGREHSTWNEHVWVSVNWTLVGRAVSSWELVLKITWSTSKRFSLVARQPCHQFPSGWPLFFSTYIS